MGANHAGRPASIAADDGRERRALRVVGLRVDDSGENPVPVCQSDGQSDGQSETQAVRFDGTEMFVSMRNINAAVQ